MKRSRSRFSVSSAPLLLFAVILVLSACGPQGHRAPVRPPEAGLSKGGIVYSNVIYQPLPSQKGIYHSVKSRDTLYKIGKLYDVPVDGIMKANALKSSTIKRGQVLYIPGHEVAGAPQTTRDIPSISIPLFPNTGHWKYIVVHHTATPDGNKATIDKIHRHRGFGDLGYHFIIDNGTKGKADGEIEIGERWYDQRDGAHAKASNFNHKSIGISLIGNFSEQRVTQTQLGSLAYLVNVLRRHYRIPRHRVIRHRDVPRAATECPGKYFPWDKFKRMLD